MKRLSGDTKRVLAYVLLALAVVIGFAIRASDTDAFEHRACQAALENRHLIADVIGNSQTDVQKPIDPTLSPAIQDLLKEAQIQQKAFLELAQKEFDQPLSVCEAIGVDSRIRLKSRNGIDLVPLPKPSDDTTTSSAESVQGIPGPPGPTGPRGSTGATGPAGPEPSTIIEPTTEPSTTTSTTQPQGLLPCITILRSC